MNRSFLTGPRLCVELILTLLIAVHSTAIGDTYTWVGTGNTVWNQAGSWSPLGTPGPGDTAIIESTKVATVKQTGSQAPDQVGVLIVEDGATLEICNASGLEIYDDSTVDGEIEFILCISVENACDTDPSGTLDIFDDLTITGDGGLIHGHLCEGANAAIHGTIMSSPGRTLTLATATGGDPLIMKGYLDVEVALINNARVGVEITGETMTLKTHRKSGTGVWFTSGGKLVFDSTLGGNGLLEIGASIGTSPEIEFNADASMGSDFSITQGLLDVHANICTTGDLTIEASDGRIVVSGPGSPSAEFHVASCP